VANESPNNLTVAGCIPPLFGSYLPKKFDPELAFDYCQPFIEGQKEQVDLWLAETFSTIAEIENAYKVITQHGETAAKPFWGSVRRKPEN
jgi:S-methylmethionine-dependent homocysteine/selenocysteine methylase